MTEAEILRTLNAHYPMRFDSLEFIRDSALERPPAAGLYDMIALYHFALQATIIEIFGPDCVDDAFFDRQLDWLYRWREQCAKSGGK